MSRVHFNKKLTIDRAQVSITYSAGRDARTDAVLSEELTINSTAIDLTKGRILIVDLTADPVRHQQVRAELPTCERIDFLKSTSDDYQSFTKRWMADLVNDSKAVAKAFPAD